MRILDTIGLSFDDVLMVPRYSTIGSRFHGDIDFSMTLFSESHHLQTPIISSNMDTVTGGKMAAEMERLGGLGIVHRFFDNPELQLDELKSLNPGRRVACIGVNNNDIERLEILRPVCDSVLIDIAHGHSRSMLRQIEAVKKEHPDLPLIAGNVATVEGTRDLISAGADCVKIGVGCGSLCSTRIATGCGVPQLSAIMYAASAVKESGRPVSIIADGGIRNSGDIMKALAAGADAVMIGGLFAGTEEAPGELRIEKTTLFKTYRGMASKEAQEDWKGFAKSIEGESVRVPYKGKVANIFEDLAAKMCSSMSYLNARNLRELRENAVFIRQTAAGLRESVPHGLLR